MKVGEVVTARPGFVVPLHNAARRLGVRIATSSFRQDGALLFRVLRIDDGWESGHVVARIPARDNGSGRWVRDDAAMSPDRAAVLKPGVRIIKPLAVVSAGVNFRRVRRIQRSVCAGSPP